VNIFIDASGLRRQCLHFLNSILSQLLLAKQSNRQRALFSSVLLSFSSLLLIYSIYFLFFVLSLSSGRIFHKTINDINDVKGEGEERETQRQREK
jgi:hypothetical protein